MKNKPYTATIDLGGTRIKAGIFKGSVLARQVEFDANPAAGLGKQLPLLAHMVDKMLDTQYISKKNVLGIGVSFAGLVDFNRKKIISTNKKYDDGPSLNLATWAKETWGCALILENDTRMALLGEWQHGAGRGNGDIVMVTLGTGVGSAVLSDGKILRGKHSQAGNLGGHFTVNYNGGRCTCGNIGCVEAEASSWRLPGLIKGHPGIGGSKLKNEKELDFKVLFNYVEKDDPVAKDILDHCISVWAAGIVSLIHAFDPEIIIIGGGIMKSSPLMLPVLKKKVSQLAWTPWGAVKIVEAKHINLAALYGADYLLRLSLKKIQ